MNVSMATLTPPPSSTCLQVQVGTLSQVTVGELVYFGSNEPLDSVIIGVIAGVVGTSFLVVIAILVVMTLCLGLKLKKAKTFKELMYIVIGYAIFSHYPNLIQTCMYSYTLHFSPTDLVMKISLCPSKRMSGINLLLPPC